MTVSIRCLGAINLIALMVAALYANFEQLAECATATKKPFTAVEPPFPQLFNPGNNQGPIHPRRVKIISEQIVEGIKTAVEEYLDLDAGLAAFQTTRINQVDASFQVDEQHHVIFTSSSLGQTFYYRPYYCVETPVNKKSLLGIDTFSVLIDGVGGGGGGGGGGDSKKKLRIFGVAAIWTHGGLVPRKYELLNTIYSKHKNVLKKRHQWTFVSKKLEVEFRLIFTEIIVLNPTASGVMALTGTKMNLESAQVVSPKTGATLRTYKVLSLEYRLSMEVYNTLLQVPVGYGCKVNQDKLVEHEDEERHKRETGFFSKRLWADSRVSLEVTGTEIDPERKTRSSDTVYVELVHGSNMINLQSRKLLMVKSRSATKELKTVLNYALNTRYSIDMQRATCDMSHLSSAINKPDDKAYTYVEDPHGGLLLEFSNGLTFSLEPEQMDYLFFNTDNYIKVKETKTWLSEKESVTYTYLERTIDSWPYGTADSNKFARQVRTFVTKAPETKPREPSLTRLESVTIWVFTGKPGQSSTIESIYQINVVDQKTGLQRWPDVAHLFDVSDQCYLHTGTEVHPTMRSSKDYAWVEFFYPLSSRQLDKLQKYATRLKGELHRKLTVDTSLLTSFQVPRLELMFTDQGLSVRALLLDMPSLDVMFERVREHELQLDPERGDLKFITPEVDHCSKLCDQYACKSLSHCQRTHVCSLGMRPVFASGDKAATGSADTSRLQAVAPSSNCTTWSTDGAELGPEALPSLAKVLSMMRHRNYDVDNAPRMPDDLIESTEWTDIAEYKRKFNEYMAQQDSPVMMLWAIFDGNRFSLVPSSFRIEDDPFEQFGANIIGAARAERDDAMLHDRSLIVDFFHEGLPMSRYKHNAFHGKHKDKASVLSGLTYDQCALGCVDSKCGTFSYCASRKECVLTAFNLIAEASQENLIEENPECIIVQRDFTKNFQRFSNIKRPLTAMAGSKADSAGDCALDCMRYEGWHACVSFEYCPKPSKSGQTRAFNCYMQKDRHPEHIFNDFSAEAEAEAEPPAGNNKRDVETDLCDHYERSALAEFNQIESAQFSGEVLDNLNVTTKLSGKTTFECADVCLNQRKDCSAFQFCLEYSDNKDNHMQQCLMILDKLLPTNSTSGRVKIELVIDPSERDNEALIRANKFLKYSENCQVFALRPNTIEGHLRDLALGNTMTIRQKEELESRAEQPASSSGYRMSWVQYLFTFVGIVKLASLITVAGFFAYQRSERVRGQMDRLRLRVRL